MQIVNKTMMITRQQTRWLSYLGWSIEHTQWSLQTCAFDITVMDYFKTTSLKIKMMPRTKNKKCIPAKRQKQATGSWSPEKLQCCDITGLFNTDSEMTNHHEKTFTFFSTCNMLTVLTPQEMKDHTDDGRELMKRLLGLSQASITASRTVRSAFL